MKSGIFLFCLLAPLAAYAAKPVPGSKYGVEARQDAQQLPAGFRGHNCRAVLVDLQKARLSKDEFETTDAFKERIRSFEKSSLLPGLREGSLLASVRNVNPAEVSYNADTGRLSVPVGQLSLPTSAPSRANAGYIADRKTIKTKQYPASNAFGKTVMVSSRQENVCAIGFTNMYSEYGKGVEHVAINVSPEEARHLKHSLAVLYLGSLALPYVEDFAYYSKATVDNPTELTLSGGTIVVDMRETIVFDARTGKILHRAKHYGENWMTEADVKR